MANIVVFVLKYNAIDVFLTEIVKKCWYQELRWVLHYECVRSNGGVGINELQWFMWYGLNKSVGAVVIMWEIIAIFVAKYLPNGNI